MGSNSRQHWQRFTESESFTGLVGPPPAETAEARTQPIATGEQSQVPVHEALALGGNSTYRNPLICEQCCCQFATPDKNMATDAAELLYMAGQIGLYILKGLTFVTSGVFLFIVHLIQVKPHDVDDEAEMRRWRAETERLEREQANQDQRDNDRHEAERRRDEKDRFRGFGNVEPGTSDRSDHDREHAETEELDHSFLGQLDRNADLINDIGRNVDYMCSKTMADDDHLTGKRNHLVNALADPNRDSRKTAAEIEDLDRELIAKRKEHERKTIRRGEISRDISDLEHRCQSLKRDIDHYSSRGDYRALDSLTREHDALKSRLAGLHGEYGQYS